MINNRQQSGRRRGRGGGPRSPNNAPNPGNRQDNRSRGNASQLHEKYKAMARDAQLSGDRVQSEYYLQFAEHYFRVLNESRSRYEEQRRQRDDYSSDDDDDQDDGVNASDSDHDDSDDRDERQERSQRNGREPRGDREPRQEAEQRNDPEQRNGAAPRPRRQRVRPDRNETQEDGNEEKISLESLPPAISTDSGEGAKPAPRRRTRKPRSEGDEIAPAA